MTDPIRLHVIGNPQTQGNKTGFVRNGRVVMVEGRRADSRQRFKDWRSAVAAEARGVTEERGTGLLSGPVLVSLTFTLTRPASHPKRRRTWPIGARSGDLDKLARACFDALTGTLFVDDAQVVGALVTKDYGDPPGVVVVVHPYIDGANPQGLVGWARQIPLDELDLITEGAPA